MDQLVEATVVEYGAPQDRAKGSNNLAANIFLHFKKVLEDFDLVKTVGTSKVVMEPAGVVGIFTPWNSSAGSIAIKVAPAIAAGCTVVIKPSEMSAMQTEVLMDAFHVERRENVTPQKQKRHSVAGQTGFVFEALASY
jgi:aldehyde dehydrogenase (NAD+)